MKIHIIYENFLTPDGARMSIGGIQTYIMNLSNLFIKLGHKVCIYQRSSIPFKKEDSNNVICGFVYGGKRKHLPQYIFNQAKKYIDKQKDIVVFACDTFVVDAIGYRSIAIQHGIFWDKPEYVNCSKFRYSFEYLKQCYRSWNIISRISKVQRLVCVDYNFLNWYRALVPYMKVNVNVIPNFTSIPEIRDEKNIDPIRIIFARRLFIYRGTRIFLDAIKRILSEYSSVQVTIAGEGPDEQYLRENLPYNNVSFIRYKSEESLSIHLKQDIAVIPTLGSEGTSLSLLEAMAAQCAVICTNVGGMTSIVLDSYNGLIINPTGDDLYCALKKMICDTSFREKVAQNAYHTVKESFSLAKWEDSWKKIIESI